MEGKKTEIAYDSKILLELEKLEARLPLGSRTSKLGRNKLTSLASGKLPEKIKFTLLRAAEINPQSRKGKVLDFLKAGPAKSVNEIAVIFNGETSEKSIQRDLLDLVKMGKISATSATKRWRKYQIYN